MPAVIPTCCLLMNQSFTAGLGNIYCSEILYDAKVSPLRKINSLSNSEIKNIIKSTKKILKRAISFGGTTIKNFIVSEEKIGYFKNKLKVYSRDKKNCLRCFKGVTIKNIKYGPIYIDIIENKEKISWVNIKLYEGKNREIRRIMEYYDLFINDLIRIQFGPFHLKNLKRGELISIEEKVLKLFIKSIGGL